MSFRLLTLLSLPVVSSEQQHWFFDHILKVFQGPDAVLQNIGVFSLRALDTLSSSLLALFLLCIVCSALSV